jgi:hypothetical protein
MGSGPAAPDWPGSDRMARLAGVARRRMRFRAATLCNGERRNREPGWPGSGRMARLAVATRRRMRFRAATLCDGERASGAGVGRVRAGSHGGRRRRGPECDFAQRPYAMGEPASRAGLAGLGLDGTGWRLRRAENAISRSYPMQWGGGQQSRVGRVRTGWHGWRAWRTTDAISARRCHTEPATGRLTRWWSGPGGSWGKAAASGRPGRRWRTAESDFRAGSPRRGGRASLPPGTCAG